MYEALMRMRLAPIFERLAEMETEVEDARRLGEGHNRVGTVADVNPGAGTCKVSHGDLTTPWVKYFNPAAGGVAETRHPSVGEQCLLLNYGGGDGGAQAFALLGVPSGQYPVVSDRAELHRRTYPDGTSCSYDHEKHEFEWINGPFSVTADREALVVMFGGVGIKLTSAGFSHVGGGVDHDGTNIGKDHLHKDTQPRAGTFSGPPQ